jgi:hypothetical protein
MNMIYAGCLVGIATIFFCNGRLARIVPRRSRPWASNPLSRRRRWAHISVDPLRIMSPRSCPRLQSRLRAVRHLRRHALMVALANQTPRGRARLEPVASA